MSSLPWDNTEDFVREIVMRDGIIREAKYGAMKIPVDDEVVFCVAQYLDDGAEFADPAPIFFQAPEVYEGAVVLLYDFALYMKVVGQHEDSVSQDQRRALHPQGCDPGSQRRRYGG